MDKNSFRRGDKRPYRTNFKPGRLWRSLSGNTIRETFDASTTTNFKQQNNIQNSTSIRRVQGGTPVIKIDSWRWEGTHQKNCVRSREKIPSSDREYNHGEHHEPCTRGHLIIIENLWPSTTNNYQWTQAGNQVNYLHADRTINHCLCTNQKYNNVRKSG